MIKIHFAGESLVVDVSEHPEILTGRYSLILSEMGFQKDLLSKRYIINDITTIRSAIEDLITFFNRRNIPVETSGEMERLQDQIRQEQEAFLKAKEHGTRVKEAVFEDTLAIGEFIRELKPYQEKAVRHMLTVENGANFSVPGSGKTTMLYAAYALWKSLGIVDRLLVIGPPSSFMAWEDEYTACFGDEAVSFRLMGPDREKRYKLAKNADIFLTTFQTATLDADAIIGMMKEFKFLMIIDESHYIKRFENGIWANTVLRMAPFAKRRAISTGTPMPNGLLDIYTQMTFLWPGKFLFGEREKYKNDVKRNSDIKWVQEAMNPFFYRVKKDDLRLPKYELHVVPVSMSRLQQKIYYILSAKTLGELDQLTSREISEIRRWRKAKVIRLLQASSNPALLSQYSQEFQVPPLAAGEVDIIELIESYAKYEKPNKIIEAVKLTESMLKQGHKVLLWSTFIHNILTLKQDLEKLGCEVYMIFGGVPKDDEENEDYNREQQIRYFKGSTRPCVLIANPAACAESISLHRECHHAIYLDRSFNCGHFLQSMDRIHRIGLAEGQETHYYILQSVETIDEIIHTRLQEKASAMYNIIEGDFPIGSMDLDIDEWSNGEEADLDFKAVQSQLRKMSGKQ